MMKVNMCFYRCLLSISRFGCKYVRDLSELSRDT